MKQYGSSGCLHRDGEAHVPAWKGEAMESNLEILRTAQVLELIKISRTTLWRRIQAGDFPAGLGPPGSRAIGWHR